MSTNPFDGIKLPTTGSPNEIGQPTFVELIWADECVTSPAISSKSPNTNVSLNRLAFDKDCVDKLTPAQPGSYNFEATENQILPKDVNKGKSTSATGKLPETNNTEQLSAQKYSLSNVTATDFKSKNASSEFNSLLLNPFAAALSEQCASETLDLDCGDAECAVDAAFCFDISGSMRPAIQAVKDSAIRMAELIKRVSGSSYRLSLFAIGHKTLPYFYDRETKIGIAPKIKDGLGSSRYIQPVVNENGLYKTYRPGFGDLFPLIGLSPCKVFLGTGESTLSAGQSEIVDPADVYDLPYAQCDNIDQFLRWIDLNPSGSYEPMHQICQAIANGGDYVTGGATQDAPDGQYINYNNAFKPRSNSNGKVLFIIHDESEDIDVDIMRSSIIEMNKCGWSVLSIYTRDPSSQQDARKLDRIYDGVGGSWVSAPNGQQMYELSSSFILSACSVKQEVFECPIGVNYIRNGKFDTNITNWDNVSDQRGIADRSVSHDSKLSALKLEGAVKQDIQQQFEANEKVVINFNAAVSDENVALSDTGPSSFKLSKERLTPPVSKGII